MREMKINAPGIDTVPEQLVKESNTELVRTLSSSPRRFEVPLPADATIIHPNTGQKTFVKAFVFVYQLLSACDLKTKDGLGEDPYLLGNTLEGELAKRNPLADTSKIESGYDTTLRSGKYYYNPRFRFSYYCEAVKRSKATMVLVESYQMGTLVQARAQISTDLSSQFVEVTDAAELDRLARIHEKLRTADKSLDERFKLFAQGLDGAESIDELDLTSEQDEANKADYFFNNRAVICELKTLRTDASDKIERVLAPYRDTPEWPLFFGQQELQKILSYLPNREEINAKVIDAITKSIERIVEKANRQIRETKKEFGLPQSGGLLVILNDFVDVFSPDLVAYRVRRSLNKLTPTRELRYPNVCVVLIIDGTHYTQLKSGTKATPITVIKNNQPSSKAVQEFVSSLLPKWSSFGGRSLVTMNADEAKSVVFRRFSDGTKTRGGPVTLQDYWELQYRKNPYLRSLSEENLLQFGKQVFEDLSPNFLKGVPRAPREHIEGLLSRFTHFLQETRARGLDMKKWVAKLDGLKERMEELYARYQRMDQ